MTSFKEVTPIHRFQDLSSSQEKELLHDAVAPKTRQANKYWLGIFESFCREKNIAIDLGRCSAEDLNEVVTKFYAGLRTKKGDVYQRGLLFQKNGSPCCCEK